MGINHWSRKIRIIQWERTVLEMSIFSYSLGMWLKKAFPLIPNLEQSGFQVQQLGQDGDGSTRHSWMKSSNPKIRLNSQTIIICDNLPKIVYANSERFRICDENTTNLLGTIRTGGQLHPHPPSPLRSKLSQTNVSTLSTQTSPVAFCSNRLWQWQGLSQSIRRHVVRFCAELGVSGSNRPVSHVILLTSTYIKRDSVSVCVWLVTSLPSPSELLLLQLLLNSSPWQHRGDVLRLRGVRNREMLYGDKLRFETPPKVIKPKYRLGQKSKLLYCGL